MVAGWISPVASLGLRSARWRDGQLDVGPERVVATAVRDHEREVVAGSAVVVAVEQGRASDVGPIDLTDCSAAAGSNSIFCFTDFVPQNIYT